MHLCSPEKHSSVRVAAIGAAAFGAALWVFGSVVADQWDEVLQAVPAGLRVLSAIGLLTGVGVWLLGIEAAFALGLMGGLLCFISFVGVILAVVPVTLVALTQGPVYAGSVALMYIGVHFVEGNFIPPLVQAVATSLPPILAILSTVACSLLFGASDVLLAAPPLDAAAHDSRGSLVRPGRSW